MKCSRNPINRILHVIYIMVLLLLLQLFSIAHCISLSSRVNSGNPLEVVQNEIDLQSQSYIDKERPEYSIQKGITALSINSHDGNALINLQNKDSERSFGMGVSDGKFSILSSSSPLVAISSEKAKIKGKSIITNSFSLNGDIEYSTNRTSSQSQWRLVEEDNFYKNQTSLGWNYSISTTCGEFYMLGGLHQLSEQIVEKTIDDLPDHDFVRVEITVHMLGTWSGETVYVKLDSSSIKSDPQYVWTSRCTSSTSTSVDKEKTSICGYESCKIGLNASVTKKHSGNYLRIIVGSTLEGNANDKAYGISDLRVYVR